MVFFQLFDIYHDSLMWPILFLWILLVYFHAGFLWLITDVVTIIQSVSS